MVKNKIKIIPLAIFIFVGNSLKLGAQTSVNLEQVAKLLTSKTNIKFIEGVEIVPDISLDPFEGKPVYKSKMPGNISLVEKVDFADIENCTAIQFKYAMMMDMEVENINNKELYNFIDDWWATNYHYGGTNRSGIDCSAFASKVLLTIYGINTPRTSIEQYHSAGKIKKEDLKEGDLVFFNTIGRHVSHVGVYLGNNFFVHSSVRSGVTINSLTDDYYGRKFVGGGRITKPL